MTFLSVIFALLALLSLAMAIVGFIKPSGIQMEKRSEAFGNGLILCVILSIGYMWLAPSDDTDIADSVVQEDTTNSTQASEEKVIN